MKDYHSVQFNLLCELDKCCREHSIPYFLSRYTAYSAMLYQSFPDRIAVPTIAMRYSDALRLVEHLDLPERKCENALKNRKISRVVIRYSAENTFFAKVDEVGQYNHRGIGIDIELIRDVPAKGLLNRIIVALEAAAAMGAYFRNLSRPWYYFLKIMELFERVILRSVYKPCKNGAQALRICRFPKKSVEFPSSFLSDRQEIDFHGHSFFVPSDFERYMAVEFSENWRNEDVQKEFEDMHLAVMAAQSDCVEAEETVKELYGKGPRINWIKWYYLRGRMRFLRKKIESYWDILFCTKDRFDFYRKYMPQKADICNMYNQGQYDQLHELLEPYLSAIVKQYQKGMVLCFDIEIFDIAVSLFEHEGKNAFAEKLREKFCRDDYRIINLDLGDSDHE